MSNIVISSKPAYKAPNNNKSNNDFHMGKKLGHETFAYCFGKDNSVLSKEACSEMVEDANDDMLPDLGAWGLDHEGAEAQFGHVDQSSLDLSQWQPANRLDANIANLDTQNTQLSRTTSRSPEWALNDSDGDSLYIVSDKLGRGISVYDSEGQLDLSQDDISKIHGVMQMGAQNTDNPGQFKEVIQTIKNEKPLKL